MNSRCCRLLSLGVGLLLMLSWTSVMAAPSEGANEILRNLTEELLRIEKPTLALIRYTGVFIIVFALVAFVTQYQKQGAGTSSFILGSALLVGSLFMNIGFFLHILSLSAFGQSDLDTANSILSYSAPTADPWSSIITFSVLLIIFVGLLGIVRGGYLLKVTGGQQGQRGRAFTLLAGGTMAVNFPTFLVFIGESFGGTIENSINRIIGT